MALSSLLGQAAARIAVRFADADTRETVSVRLPDGRDEEQYLFGAADNICGTVRAAPSFTPLRAARCAQHTLRTRGSGGRAGA